MAHAKLSPSKAYQWSACTSSVGLIDELIQTQRLAKDSDAGPAALAGTRAHDLAAKLLTGEEVVFDSAEQENAVRGYVARCRAYVFSGCQVFVEQAVPLVYSPEETGTVDFAVVAGGGASIVIRDYKNGSGVQEVSLNNKQMTIYALSLVQWLENTGLYDGISDATEVTMEIDQPLFHSGDTTPVPWTLSLGTLRAWYSDNIASGVFEIESGVTAFRPDPEDACVFCRAKPFCKAYAEYMTHDIPTLDDLPSTAIETVPDKPTPLPSVRSLTEAQVGLVLARRKELVKWLNECEDMVLERLEGGLSFPGWKLVKGRDGNRAWTDEKAAETLLSNELTAEERYKPRELVSPTQAEKLLTGKELSARFKNRFEALVSRSEGKPTLAPESDPRPALRPKIEDMPDVAAQSEAEGMLG